MIQTTTENVTEVTRIVTYKWRAYEKALSLLPNFKHQSVNHSIDFVDPNDSTIHTQNIEGLWSRRKYFIRKRKNVSF
jgi:hypothetical protein